MYEIEEGIRPEDIPPIPRGVPRGRQGSKYPLSEMQPGQSFFVPRDEKRALNTDRARLHSAVSRFKSWNPDRVYSVRFDAENNGFRIFRLEDKA